jgi:hypothetical protein
VPARPPGESKEFESRDSMIKSEARRDVGLGLAGFLRSFEFRY